jgi:ketosteroid isomerase-like protein
MSETMTDLAAFDARIDELASRADLEALRAVLADDFVYVHSTGNRQNRTEWLESLLPLAGKRERVVSNVEVDLHGDVAVVTGDLDIVWKDRPTVTNRYVRVLRKDGDVWRAISQRTVPAPDRV